MLVLASRRMLISIPYIGKIIFLHYLLLGRLDARLPMAIQTTSKYYISFDNTGPSVRYLSEPLFSDPRLEKCLGLGRQQ